MTRLLHAPTVGPAPRRLDAPAPTIDQATRDLLDRVEREAYVRGHADGTRSAREDLDRAAGRVEGAVAHAVATARSMLDEAVAGQATAVTATARRLAEAILGSDLQAGGVALLDRVRAAVDALDHGPFTVHLAPVDHELVADRTLPADVAVAADPSLQPGEARVTGPWSGADLTLSAILDTLLEDAP